MVTLSNGLCLSAFHPKASQGNGASISSMNRVGCSTETRLMCLISIPNQQDPVGQPCPVVPLCCLQKWEHQRDELCVPSALPHWAQPHLSQRRLCMAEQSGSPGPLAGAEIS